MAGEVAPEVAPADGGAAPNERAPLAPLDSDSFDEAIYDDAEPSVVLFSRASCAVCRSVRPVVERVARDAGAEGPWRFFVVDAEASLDLVRRLALSGVPQVLVFVDGELRAQHAGELSVSELEGLLSKAR